MTKEETLEQLESLIEAWELNEADLNQTDINAIKYIIEENNKQDQIIREARELLNDNSERCKSALTNPEYTIVSKHELLKLEINDIKGVMEILDRNVK